MSRNVSNLSREEQLKLWKEKKLEEKRKAKMDSQKKSPCFSSSSGKSLIGAGPATRSQNAQKSPFMTQNLNAPRTLDSKPSKLHQRVHTRTLSVQDIEAPTATNADSPFDSDMVSPLTSIFQKSPYGEGSVGQSTSFRGAESRDNSKFMRRRRTDSSTLLLPIPSLREHMAQSTTSPAIGHDQENVSPANPISAQKVVATGKTCHETSLDRKLQPLTTPESNCNLDTNKATDLEIERLNTLTTPESDSTVFENSATDPRTDGLTTLRTPESDNAISHNSATESKTDRLMDIDEENCITEWTIRDISPPIPRARRRTDSLSLLLPIPSLRNTLTPPDHDASPACDTLGSTNESASSTDLAPTATPSYFLDECNSRRRRRDKSRRSTGDMNSGRRNDSPTLLLPIPSLREEFTFSQEGSAINNQLAPAYEDLETEQSTPLESSAFYVRKPIDGQPCDSVVHPSPKWQTSLVAEQETVLVEHFTLHITDGWPSGSIAIDHREVDAEHGTKPDHSALRDSYNESYTSESDELKDHSLNRQLAEAYREPVKLNGRTVLHSIDEEPQNHLDEVNRLRDQVEQLSVENTSLKSRLQKFRHDYEERITPFRDVFEQHAKLKKENKQLLLLKAENNILQSQNKEITEGIAMLEAQMMIALQKALERQKTLEDERDQAKRQVAELEQKIQKLSVK
ncbi:hypothetical protein FisN_3Lh128 [Fistulifera solaris]|uniref:Uncharacterized protein n=1 Tax=Fistulifera solaris TaxID=1519565 RepID=A0A1Z5JHT5_FISSO|nr:hypothetical protein FisN_3Lh128 [Fistulifera solaris]|eukprot:GAX13560.1 hypothetical protein FisN_3Lh128 [Fistulifera solaris]